jgi:hypothetical protein
VKLRNPGISRRWRVLGGIVIAIVIASAAVITSSGLRAAAVDPLVVGISWDEHQLFGPPGTPTNLAGTVTCSAPVDLVVSVVATITAGPLGPLPEPARLIEIPGDTVACTGVDRFGLSYVPITVPEDASEYRIEYRVVGVDPSDNSQVGLGGDAFGTLAATRDPAFVIGISMDADLPVLPSANRAWVGGTVTCSVPIKVVTNIYLDYELPGGQAHTEFLAEELSCDRATAFGTSLLVSIATPEIGSDVSVRAEVQTLAGDVTGTWDGAMRVVPSL